MGLTSHDGQVGLEAGVDLGQAISHQTVLVLGLAPYFGIAVEHPLAIPVPLRFVITITFDTVVSHKLLGEVLGRPRYELRHQFRPGKRTVGQERHIGGLGSSGHGSGGWYQRSLCGGVGVVLTTGMTTFTSSPSGMR